jgi:hypothetical protein
MTQTANWTVYKTRFPELSYMKHAADLWRVIDTETGCAVGQHYRTRIELLSDLDRYASEYLGLATKVQS